MMHHSDKLEGKDILVVGIQPWDYHIGSNCKNIAIEFARHNRVLYVNQPLDRITRLRNATKPEVKKRLSIIRGKQDGLEEINENLWVFYPSKMAESINKLPDNGIYDYFNLRNNKIFASEIKKAIQALDFKLDVLFNDSSMFLGYHLKELLNPGVSIYYTRDNLISQPYFGKHGTRLEPQLAQNYDAVVSNSDYLAMVLRKANPQSYMVGQGCDLSLFDREANYRVPEDLSSIPGPIVGYIGFLTSMRLDIELLVHFSKSNPDINLVLIGPEDDDFKNSELHKLGNVYFLGSKDSTLLPSYIKGFDVAINPQVVNEMTVGNYPRKIDEYLAMGKPTLATYTETMEYFKDHVYLSRSKEEFSDLAKKAIEENTPQLETERSNFASEHTWENNVKNIYEVINMITESRKKDPVQ